MSILPRRNCKKTRIIVFAHVVQHFNFVHTFFSWGRQVLPNFRHPWNSRSLTNVKCTTCFIPRVRIQRLFIPRVAGKNMLSLPYNYRCCLFLLNLDFAILGLTVWRNTNLRTFEQIAMYKIEAAIKSLKCCTRRRLAYEQHNVENLRRGGVPDRQYGWKAISRRREQEKR